MAKQHEVFDHTADIGLQASADSLAELFEALAEGLAAIICEAESIHSAETRQVQVSEQEEDVEGLLVDFLWQVLGLIEQHFLIRSVHVANIDGRELRAELAGEAYDPTRHELLREVKAVTWHGLLVAERQGTWQGKVILDL